MATPDATMRIVIVVSIDVNVIATRDPVRRELIERSVLPTDREMVNGVVAQAISISPTPMYAPTEMSECPWAPFEQTLVEPEPAEWHTDETFNPRNNIATTRPRPPTPAHLQACCTRLAVTISFRASRRLNHPNSATKKVVRRRAPTTSCNPRANSPAGLIDDDEAALE